MSRMSSVSKLENETYKCIACKKEFAFDDVKNSWTCPECNDFIHIYAEDKETQTRLVLIRKKASDLEKDDFIHFPCDLCGRPYRVLDVNILKKKLGVNLEGFGQYKISPDEPINCRMGTWY